jgi:N utilization substance protein A
MKSEFTLAFNEITERFGLSQETVMESLEAAMVAAYRRSVNASSAQNVEVTIEPESGDVVVFAEKEVVEDVENPLTEVELTRALTVDPETELGGMVMVESTPTDFGRVAAQTAKQVILQRLREAEREAQYEEFIDREGEMVHGTVHSISPQAVTVGLGRAEAILPRNQQIPGEHFRVRDRIRVYVLEVRKSSRGPVIVVSRTHPNMLRRLLEMEVPEINQGLVEIKAIAREAGKRAKVAVAALREGVDPVGACVGMRGVRIQSIVRDLNDEKIDVIEWNPESSVFISKALSPARVSGVFLDDNLERGKTAMVVVPEDQLSLAIGRAGVNARLSAKLTGWRIDIKSLTEAAIDSLSILTSDSEFAEMAKDEADVLEHVETILNKRADNRPITPEEYQILTAFVKLVQTEIEARREAIRRVEREARAEIRDTIPEGAYLVSMEDFGLTTRVQNLLSDAGFGSAGAVMEELGLDEKAFLARDGIGPKAVEEIRTVFKELVKDLPEIVEEPIPVEDEAEALVEEAAVEDADLEAVEGVEAAEEIAEPVAEGESEAAAGEIVEEAIQEPQPELAEDLVEGEVEEVEPTTMEEVLEFFGDEFDPAIAGRGEFVDEDEDEFESLEAKRAKERKRSSRVMEFDPESGETFVTRRRKRESDDEWDAEIDI